MRNVGHLRVNRRKVDFSRKKVNFYESRDLVSLLPLTN